MIKLGAPRRPRSSSVLDASSPAESPIRAEIYSVDRLEEYAHYLADQLKTGPEAKTQQPVLARVKQNGILLLRAYRTLSTAIHKKDTISPAAEWFTDNFHIVEDQLREIREDLPPAFYKGLPKLATGELAGYPRVYALALALVAHTDSQLEPETIRRFVVSFQRTCPLEMGELWALAITLRLVLVENLKRIVLRVVFDLEKVEHANELSDALFESVGDPAAFRALVNELTEACGETTPGDCAFVAQVTKRLRDQEPELWPALQSIEEHLVRQATSTEALVNAAHQLQAANQVTVANVITSMRMLAGLNWSDLFESVSLIEARLRAEPTAEYPHMDFKTRDRYRHVIERVSKRTGLSETEVVEGALKLAVEHRCHVGYYLIGDGARLLGAALGHPIRTRFFEWVFANPNLIYFGLFTLLFLGIGAIPVAYASRHVSGLPLVWIALLALVPASEVAVSALNLLLTRVIHPRVLPKFALESGIPESARTFVVIPCLLFNPQTIRELLEKLEIHYLRNGDAGIYFALLTDFKDAATETTAEDDEYLRLAREGIERLNARHVPGGEKRFFLFHRARRFNERERVWMGWERKRGKVHEFNRLLRGARDTTYSTVTAPASLLPGIRYVITLDADTQLPRDSARKLIGTIVHPLNRAVFDPACGRVTHGYGILQPRIGISIESSNTSLFARIFSGYVGIDPYTTAVSDVYQDLFAEGSYTGKGIYDVDAFESALEGRVPENTVLSHDLFEGMFARVGLLSDVELIDDFPRTYRTFFERQHRWTRGDWQIASWLGHALTGPKRLPLVSRWKIFDNLRRSLVTPTLCLWLILAWGALPGTPAFWVGSALTVYLFPLVVDTLLRFVSVLTSRKRHLSEIGGPLAMGLTQIGIHLLLLAHQAIVHVDAIVRALYRLNVSKRKLLEWSPAAASEDQTMQLDTPIWKTTWFPELMLISVLTLLYIFREGIAPPALAAGCALTFAWMLFPETARRLSRSRITTNDALPTSDVRLLRQIARRTWYYFESFVGPEDNWLPVDNYQEDPTPLVAHRTSPTNMGLYLLSLTSARDLGYLSISTLLSRLRATLDSFDKLEQFEGHYYNWYDTQSLQPLNPKYVSTVDSGNLAGYLLAVKQFCLSVPRLPIAEVALLDGLRDSLAAIRHEVTRNHKDAAAYKSLQSALEDCETLAARPYINGLHGWAGHLALVAQSLHLLRAATPALPTLRSWITLEIDKFEGARTKFMEAIPDPRLVESLGENPSLQAVHDLIGGEELRATLSEARGLAETMERIFSAMNFKFLIHPERGMFAIGYNVSDGELDKGLYDLLASESRLASFIAIAKGDAPQKQWFLLGRRLVPAGRERALISWSASMFEYLMPLLVMRDYDNTLLAESNHAVVDRQIAYGADNHVPWGVSEAGYNARDLQLNYQYGPFGIPGLGLKRGLSHDLVISPYSTFLAALVKPRAALENVKRLMNHGLLADHGFYEAVDYTPERLPEHRKSSVIKSHMAHHQGMSLVAINNLVNHFVVQNRFHAEPRVRATRLLLHERIPEGVVAILPKTAEIELESVVKTTTHPCIRHFGLPDDAGMHIQLLSNRAYGVMISTAGAGYSKFRDLAVTRWREDATRDHWGNFIFVRDLAEEVAWSSTYQPTIKEPDSYKVTFSEENVEFRRTDGEITTYTQILVAPEDNVEIRHVTLNNHSKVDRVLEVTSYLEPVLAGANGDLDHLAFSKLFLQTEYWPLKNALLAKRRKRSAHDRECWGIHVAVTDGELVSEIQYETDRAQFIGRGRTLANPRALGEGAPLTNSVGSTLDPIFSIRMRVKIPAGGKAHFAFTTGVTATREEALNVTDRYHDIHSFERERKLAWTKSQADLRHLNIDAETAYLFQRLAERIIYSESTLRPPSQKLAIHTRAQSTLWPHGISGDLPIVTVRITDRKELVVVRQLLRCHEYLRMKGLVYDFVILNEHKSNYFQEVQELILQQIRTAGSQELINKPGGVFVLRCGPPPETSSAAIQSMARVSLAADHPLKEQIDRRLPDRKYPAALLLTEEKRRDQVPAVAVPEMSFFNGLGGFSGDGREYVIVLKPGQWTPAPWINVIGNSENFGFQISETGSGYTWSVNSQANRLTPWSNDPVSDPAGEIIYLRDDETGEVWTPTPLPIREEADYVIRHGQGYTTFEYVNHGIHHTLTVFVPAKDTVKISHLKLRNLSGRKRRITLTTYTEWVLGTQREKTAHHLLCDVDPESRAIFARNPRDNEFSSRVAFVDLAASERVFTCSRREFLGRHGSTASPAALLRQGLAGKKGTGRDPCAVLQTSFELASGATWETAAMLGQCGDEAAARALTLKYRDLAVVRAARDEVLGLWAKLNQTIQVHTPDPALDVMINHWLFYQTLSCRFWSRTAFYQSGGAFGFRDQLQDCMALVYAAPGLTREQILRAAARQFPEGDVQHWWHEPTGRGIRTKISDDLLWLPFVVSFYIGVTGDRAILEEMVPFIEAPILRADQEDSYTTPTISSSGATILDHCKRTVERSLELGAHGLPLIGTGDWNDGMNRVGDQGKGESVWMGWFLHRVIEDFLPFCAGEPELCARWREHQTKLKAGLEGQGWDGEWYRRAFFDDGTPIGSAANDECRIDSIAQSWSVLSGVGDRERSVRAMKKLAEFLVLPESELILLLTPPFDQMAHDPGYIKGYVPGVRENGGQYTHAAVWAIMAFAGLGEGETAHRLFRMLNPVRHAETPAAVDRYKIEPYVLAGDVYAGGALDGRGGWSWYTGSAAWFYRAGLESLLGFHLRGGDRLAINPCIPPTWKSYSIEYTRGKARYLIEVRNPQGLSQGSTSIEVDGVALGGDEIGLVDDGREHRVIVTLKSGDGDKGKVKSPLRENPIQNL